MNGAGYVKLNGMAVVKAIIGFGLLNQVFSRPFSNLATAFNPALLGHTTPIRTRHGMRPMYTMLAIPIKKGALLGAL